MTELEKLIAMVRQLRDAQRACTRTSSDRAQAQAQDAERMLDIYLAALARGPDLYDPEGRP